MQPVDQHKLMLIDRDEFNRRIDHIKSQMAEPGIPALLISDNANKYYVTGRVFDGYVYIPLEGPVIFFIRRPVELEGDGVVYIRKPEDIASSIGLNVPEAIGLELDVLPYSTATRLKNIFPESELKNASGVMRRARAVKTPAQIDMIRHSGIKHVHVYSRIQHIFQSGMTDMELQVEIERVVLVSSESVATLWSFTWAMCLSATMPTHLPPMISQWEVRDWTRRCQSEHVAHQ